MRSTKSPRRKRTKTTRQAHQRPPQWRHLAGPEILEVRAAPGASVGGLIVGSGLLWWFDPFFGPFGNEGWASRAGDGTSGARRPFDFLSNERSSAVRRICLDEFQD